ncbi:MAG: DUF6089 family protein [Saprospiraceae bacterium]
MLKYLLTALFLAACLGLFGQSEGSPWEIGLQIGTSSMGGELIENDIIFLNQPSLAGGIMVRRRIGGVLALRLHALYGRLEGDDSKSEDAAQAARGFKAETEIFEPGLVLEFSPFGARRPKISPYLYGGIGYAIWSKPDVDFNGMTNANIALDQAADFDTRKLTFPLGGGLRFNISPKSSIALDIGFRPIASDYLDGISRAGNPDKDDTYVFTGLQFSTGFGKSNDADKDGIKDDVDACPNEAGPENTQGCPDRDGDGIADRDDQCPDQAGEANLAGCPDSDGDGFADKNDECPNQAGTLNGCPDSDGDGIADKDDPCPNEAGTVGGCPDGDGDGFADKDDECPTQSGPVRGCPDSDNDGIADKDDKCPNEAGTMANSGCPDAPQGESRTDRDNRLTSLTTDLKDISYDPATGMVTISRLYFPTDVDDLSQVDMSILDQVVTFLQADPAFTVRLEGHADRRASDAYNQALSERRSQAAYDYLVRKGVDTGRLSQIGLGETQPVGTSLRENRVVIPMATDDFRN